MNQQEAQNQYNEKLKAFQEETIFEYANISVMHPHYLNALHGLSVMQLKVSLEDYKASIEKKERYNLKIAGLILHVVEKATPEQLGLSVEEYVLLMGLCADAATAWQEAVTPFATTLRDELEKSIVEEKPEPQPKVKELFKKKNKA